MSLNDSLFEMCKRPYLLNASFDFHEFSAKSNALLGLSFELRHTFVCAFF